MKILLVEDDILISTALADLLRANHYTVDSANDGETGLNLAMSAEFDLILLDWLIPKLDGITLCRELRSHGYCKPILLLTAKNATADIVVGLDAGADDYVIKPYQPEILLAKIRSLLSRGGVIASSKLSWGNLILDLNYGSVTCDEQVISLTATEYKLLELFLQNPNRIFSRRAILDHLWRFDDIPGENAVTTHIKDLRKKLKAGGLTQEILETVYGMGYRLKPAPGDPVSNHTVTSQQQDTHKKGTSKNLDSVNRVLEKFRNSFSEQVKILEQAKTALLAGDLHTKLKQQALHEAHKLSGSMAMFGYPEGSKLAREIEHLLLENRTQKDHEISLFSQLITQLQEVLTKPLATITAEPEPLSRTHRVLVIDDDATMTDQLLSKADAWGIKMKIAPDLTTARSRLALATPDAVLLDLNFPGNQEDGLTLLHELVESYPNLPIIVFTVRDSLADRLAASRLGARKFLHKPSTTEQIFQAIASVLPEVKLSQATILIVDDDPVMLTELSQLLSPWGLKVVTLSEPQHFWDVLIATSPNLVLLDLEMPIVNGLELCQVVRQDAQWGDLPVLVVTAHSDAQFVEQAFARGADDFISKPVLEPQLITRVLSHIERRSSRHSF
ncbi:response regulator [Aetokthonos hydrillicola Thurmond2011]|jgi:DNA-binding response OmpR family regulator|uniref:Response regulator n=1 Tax=Aetokthonos hydrillicola Thurmond2011 TaxID=2712845 RepID=A0AAP5IDQ6_9CYAN|nr:response regulator [Aetokthonos hydrillicola]MBO3458002.1 response regulator [Aetokthonos hydrillicola CCALA 1050]MBW4587164.1 response regulator [Aetokthonos hydrillicola CCALA 1050]MDR9899332.1 response regulator [Aetokthonos hydrillicola Thurmond2011]